MPARSRTTVAVIGLVIFFPLGTVHANQLREANSSPSFSAIDRVYDNVSLRLFGDSSQPPPETFFPEESAQQTITLDFTSVASEDVTPGQPWQRVPEPSGVALLGSGLFVFKFVLRAKHQQRRGAAEPV